MAIRIKCQVRHGSHWILLDLTLCHLSRSAFGITYAGEFSNGFNDCGLFLEGVGGQPTFGGNCDVWQDASGWDAGTKAGIQAFSEASMDALRDWFFWTWKVGSSSWYRLIFIKHTTLSTGRELLIWYRRVPPLVIPAGASGRLDAA